MTLDNSDHATQPGPGGPPIALDFQKITICVKSDGTFDPTSYTADEGDDCACVPAPGSTFTGTVVCKQGTKVLATWSVNAAYTYKVPSPNPPGTPYVACSLTSVPSGAGTNRTGTINIGTRPPLLPLGAPPAKPPSID